VLSQAQQWAIKGISPGLGDLSPAGGAP